MFERKQENPISTYIQPSLEIGKEDDEHEKEANSVADKVMCMREPGVERKMMATGKRKVQPMFNPTAGKTGTMNTGKPVVRKMSAGKSGMKASPNVEQGIHSTKGNGQSLQQELQQEMGSKIGADFGSVRIHTGSHAAEMNQEIGAKAFTHGNDIYFNRGQYDPASDHGKHLLAHELTHTVQQSGMVNPMIQKSDFKPDQKVTTGGGDWTTVLSEYRFIYEPVWSDDMSVSLPISYTPRGAVMKLTFTPTEDIKKQATQIGLVQKVVTMDATKEPEKDKLRVSDESVYKDGKAYKDQTDMNRAVASGARIDKPSTDDNPIYTAESQYGDPATETSRNATKKLADTKDSDVIHKDDLADMGKKEFYGHQYNSKKGDTNYSTAVLVDTPKLFPSWTHPAGQTFEVAALVVDGAEAVKGKYLGSVSWGWRSTGKDTTGETTEYTNKPITPGKSAELLDLTLVSADFISPEFVEVAKKWNESKTSDANIETIDLPTTQK
ncbi:MAG: DUF4157 domain-containing protein [Bacteroidia bacterium]